MPAVPAGDAPSASEAAAHADFSRVRYAQCWEDADVLLGALAVQPGATCLSIASAGDNTLALLARAPARVVAIDLNPAQLACLELRVAAYRELEHPELLELLGSRPSVRRAALFRRCRDRISDAGRAFWDAQPEAIAAGFGTAGKFERYLATFRRRILPLVHGRNRVNRLLQGGGSSGEREVFYERTWNTWRWRLMFRLFFSRFVMGRMGRDPSFFRYVEGSVADRILRRARHAATALDPAENSYLQWILTGWHPGALPFALRPENFTAIRDNLDRLEWHCCSLEGYLEANPGERFDAYNLSDIFEYMSPANYEGLLDRIIRSARSGARLAYWNTLVDRRRPERFASRLRSLDDLARALHARDQAFFYCAFHVEAVV